MHCTVEEIASFLETSSSVLRHACADKYQMLITEKVAEWAKGGKCSLRRKQWALADNNAAMCIFLGKQYLGQEDNYGVGHKGHVKTEVVHYGEGEPKQWKSPDAKDGSDGES